MDIYLLNQLWASERLYFKPECGNKWSLVFKANLNFNSISSINGQTQLHRGKLLILSYDWPTYWVFEKRELVRFENQFKGTSSMNKFAHNDDYLFDLLLWAHEK